MIQTKPQTNRLNLSVSPKGDEDKKLSPSPRLWDMDVESKDKEAIDKILEHLIRTGSRPSVMVTGDLIDVVTAITNTLNKSVPSTLSYPLKTMTDYIARWLCDYVDETGATTLRVSFGFDALTIKERSQS